jgi:CheY-like chemotaxis protein
MKRLLIVDDDPDVLESVALILEDGYAVSIARNGVDALRRIETEHFDAILLDLGMPLKDGGEVLREMAARGLEVPVILVSATPNLVARARALGATDCLVKPFTAERLEAKVAALVGARASIHAAQRPAMQLRAQAAASNVTAMSLTSGSPITVRPPPGSARNSSRARRTESLARRMPDREVLGRARELMEARNSVLAELQHIPPDAFLTACARRLGVAHDGEVLRADVGAQLAFLDFCTHAFETRGRVALELYRYQQTSAPTATARIVLDAMARARFSLFEVRRCLGREGAVLRDLLGCRRFTVIDDGVAQTVGTRLVARVAPFEEFALLTAPCRIVDDALAATLQSDIVAMGPFVRERLGGTERKSQVELAEWLLRACFEAAAGHAAWPLATSLARH